MSNSSYYQIFRSACFDLVRTIAIKFDATAQCVNGAVLEEHPSLPVDSSDPSTWRYYQNMAGLYHETNTPMLVTSLDTLQTISFDKQTLQSHPDTLEAYRYGTRQHTQLRESYPDQHDLIMGILYAPARAGYVQELINAKDGTLLYWDPKLVESQEHTLMHDLQKRLYTYTQRWHNRDYARIDNLYQASFLWQLALHVLQMVYIERQRRCRTHEAHSYHVRQYLASNGALDAYMNQLTTEQIHFLYRNILYLENHSGRKEVFNWLVDNILTVRGLPLYEYSMRHNVFYQIPSVDNNQSLSFTPRTYFKRKALNVAERASAGAELSTDTLLTKLEPAAPGNAVYHQDHRSDIHRGFDYSPSNVVQTKVLESVLVDNTQAVPYPLIGIAFNQWAYWASKGVYTAHAVLKLTGTKKDVSLNMLELLTLWMYAGYMANGDNVTIIPPIKVSHVQVDANPGIKALVDVTDPKYVSHADLLALLSTYVAVPTLTTVDSFYQTVQVLFNSSLQQYRIIHGQGSSLSIAGYQAATQQLYKDSLVTSEYTGQLYSDWLASRGISFEGYTLFNYRQLQLSIFDLVTNYQLNYSSAEKEVQKAMMKLMSQLLSYSVLIVGDMQETSVELSESAPHRVQLWVDQYASTDHARMASMDIFTVATETRDTVAIDLSAQIVQDSRMQTMLPAEMMFPSVTAETSAHSVSQDMPIHWRVMSSVEESTPSSWVSLTLAQKQYLVA